jgi:TPR repeat protein
VTASFDKTARVWDVATGHQLLILNGHSGTVATASFSADGKRIVTASDDKTARTWDAATGQQLVLLSGHTDRVTSAAFSPNDQDIITSSLDKTARIWDAATGQQLLAARHTELVETAAYSPDGIHFVTASDDKLAHIWTSHIAPVTSQIQWARAAQFDPLPESERFQLGLTPDTHVWPMNRSRCDESAAAPYDPDRRASGAMLDDIVTDVAIKACTPKQTTDARIVYQHGRALLANGDIPGATREFQNALSQGHRAAAVDLAKVLMPANPRQAIQLYERAWNNGISIAAFSLATLYETGIRHGDNDLLAPDRALAWAWYQKAADGGEPNALARFAQRAEADTRDPAQQLEAFEYYAAACERARNEDWPDDSWRDWRYRRAYLARLLAHQGKMVEVAERYAAVRTKYAPPAAGFWR